MLYSVNRLFLYGKYGIIFNKNKDDLLTISLKEFN